MCVGRRAVDSLAAQYGDGRRNSAARASATSAASCAAGGGGGGGDDCSDLAGGAIRGGTGRGRASVVPCGVPDGSAPTTATFPPVALCEPHTATPQAHAQPQACIPPLTRARSVASLNIDTQRVGRSSLAQASVWHSPRLRTTALRRCRRARAHSASRAPQPRARRHSTQIQSRTGLCASVRRPRRESCWSRNCRSLGGCQRPPRRHCTWGGRRASPSTSLSTQRVGRLRLWGGTRTASWRAGRSSGRTVTDVTRAHRYCAYPRTDGHVHVGAHAHARVLPVDEGPRDRRRVVRIDEGIDVGRRARDSCGVLRVLLSPLWPGAPRRQPERPRVLIAVVVPEVPASRCVIADTQGRSPG